MILAHHAVKQSHVATAALPLRRERGRCERMTAGVSPEVTGGVGVSFERAAAAVYLAALLTQSAGPGVPGPVIGVAAQLDAPLDDLTVRWRHGDGRTGMLSLQLKHRLVVSAAPSNGDFADIVAAAWRTIEAPGFQSGLDRAGTGAERLSTDAYYAALNLTEIAELAENGAAFASALAAPGRAGAEALRVHAAAATNLARVLGRAASNDEMLRFWRHFVILRLEATHHLHGDRLRASDQLRALTRGRTDLDASRLFGMLELIAGPLNTRAASVDAEQVLRLLEERYALRLAGFDPDLDVIAARARTAARRDMEAWRAYLGIPAVAPHFAPVDAVDGAATPEAPFGLDGVEAYLRHRRSFTILGVPGAGKTNSLVQIAAALLDASDLIPIVQRLPALAQRQDPILDAIGASDHFQEGGPQDLAGLAGAGRLVLLLDGWNELSEAQRDWAWTALDELKRLHPALLLVTTSRSGSARAFATDVRVELLEFDRDRQLEAATLRHGSAGSQLLARARARPGLRALLRIPLFLGAILDQAARGSLPSDRETAIAQLVEVARGSPQCIETMRRTLDGQQFGLLQTFAFELMHRETVILGEPELVVLLADALDRLRTERRLFQSISPLQAIDQLLTDRLLVAWGEPGQREIGFSHQLLQEWFASRRLETMIAGRSIEGKLLELVDAPFWSTTVLFATERLARSQSAVPLRQLVAATLGIEPFLAAEMLVRMPEEMAAPLDPLLARFAEEWAIDQPQRAVAFMLASGRSQFSEAIWHALREHRDIVIGLRRFRHGFPLSAIEPGWERHFPALSDQARRILLIEVIDQGDAAGLDLVVEATLAETSADVVGGVIDYLDFHDERAHLNALLGRLPDEMGREIARERIPEGADTANRERWTAWRRSRFDTAQGIEWIHLALEFDCASPDEIVAAMLAIKTDSYWTSQALYDRVAERHPDALARALAARLRSGERLPYGADQYLGEVGAADSADFYTIAATEADWGRRRDAARMLDGKAVEALVDELLQASGNADFRRDKHTHNLFDALEHVRLPLLLAALDRCDPTSPDHIAVATRVLAGWKADEDREPRLPLAPGARSNLVERIRTWVATLLGMRGPRYELSELARLIGRVGDTALLPQLLALWDADRSRRRAQQLAFAACGYRSHDSEARMGYDNLYREAAVRIGGDVVIEAMVARFADEEWEVDAAVVLGQLLVVDPHPRNAFGPGYDELTERRNALAKRRTRGPAAAAAMILDRIDQLVAQSDDAVVHRAFQLAGPVLHMDYGDRVQSLRALFDAGGAARSYRDFCTAFGERGELLPAHVVHEGLTAAAAEYDSKSWHQNDDEWQVKAWLRLAAFSDDPKAALGDLSALPKRVMQLGGLHDVIFALGYSTTPSAVLALRAIHSGYPEVLFDAAWPRALAQIGTHEAAEALLDAIGATPDDTKKWRDTYGVTSALASLTRQGDARDKAFAMLETATHAPKMSLLAAAILETLDEADAIRLLDLVERPQRASIGRELISRLENAAVTRLPVPGMSNAYELQAAPLTSLRKHGFALLLAGGPGAIWAKRCLEAVDRLRDEYGKPMDEPNHPDLVFKVPWPAAGKAGWDLAAIDWK